MDLRRYFREEVFFKRTVSSICWTLCQEFVLITILTLIANVSLWSPLVSVKAWFGAVFSLSSIGCYLMCGATTVLIDALHAFNYSVVPKLPRNVLETVWCLVSPRHVFFLALHVVAGGTLSHCCIRMLFPNRSALSVQCDVNDALSRACLNDTHLIPVLFGGLLGGVFGASYFIQHRYCIDFPIIQQLKFLVVRSNFGHLVRRSAVVAIINLKWFLPFYLIFGPSLRQWLSEVFHLQLRDGSAHMPLLGVESGLVASLRRLVDLDVLFCMFFCGTFVVFAFNSFLFTFRIFMTERFRFEIDASPDGHDKVTLHRALQCTSDPTIQHLGYLDLHLLARDSPERRTEIYAISHPGGHPYNWESVQSSCLHLVDTFANKFNEPAKNESAAGDGAQGVKFKQVVQSIASKRPLSYILSEFPDYRAAQTFVECQTLVWAMEAVSFLIAHSVREDRFGVVQKSLPDVLTKLFDLQMCLERHQKRPSVLKRSVLEDLPREVWLRQKVRTTLTSSIYRIVLSLGKHISGVPLPSEYVYHLNRYLTFKE